MLSKVCNVAKATQITLDGLGDLNHTMYSLS